MAEKCWEDFEVGDKFKTQAVTITETHLVNWTSLTGDWYPLHTDEEFAKETAFGGRIAHGPLTFALAVGLVGMSGIFGDSLMAWLGMDKMRLPLPVRIGDTIHVEPEVIVKGETSKVDRGVTTFKYVVNNQRDEVVGEWEFAVLMHRR